MAEEEKEPAHTPGFLKKAARVALWCFLIVLAIAGLSAAAIVADGLTDDSVPSDVAIVLGNEVKADGTPSARLQARLEKALRVYQEGLVQHVFVSGGTGVSGYDEAVCMKRYLVEKGVPEDRIECDSEGLNTFLTARNASQWMAGHGFVSAIVVTQYFHVPRSKLALRRCGVREVHSAHAEFFELRDVYSVVREVVAWPVYFVRHYE